MALRNLKDPSSLAALSVERVGGSAAVVGIPRQPQRRTISQPPHQRPSGIDQADTALTARQLECLAWVQEGKSATDIGVILGLSPRTVEGHLAKICAALGVRTRIQAVIKAKELGLLWP